MPVVTQFRARRSRRAAWLAATCLVALLCAGLTACASPADDQPDAAETTSGAGEPDPSTTDEGPEPSFIIQWIREFMPEGGGGGTREAVYLMLMQGECADAYALALDDTESGPQRPLRQPFRNLYAAAAAACLAAFEGQADRWQDAESRLASVQPTDLGCWDQEIYEITTALIDAHRSDARTTFERSSDGESSECPLLTRIEPSHGPESGGYSVRIYGENLPASLPLFFDDVQVDAIRQPDGSATVEVPAAEHLGIVLIRINGAPGRGAGSTLSFNYDADVPEPTPTQDERTSEKPVPDQSATDEPTPAPTP
ncbi:MAG: IPT/TIG domain-containing protein [Vicinamibacterales bacterium]